ncbi:hypothetical protein FO519_005688 [Halicephalobus sp. NKZ332]|nr:hypothetical protein FO519_005688 [Halicephalobus sp. NKZ332]
MKDLNCQLLFSLSDERSRYRENFIENRVVYENDPSLKTDCDSIRSRGYFQERALTSEEEDFPIAFAKIVYKEYYLLESQLRVEYAPQNFYCYLIDSKADELFKKQLRNLGKCFDNIFVLDEEVDIKNDGHNMTIAHLTCLKHLRSHSWKYVVLLQNDDMRLRTNAEMVQIFKTFNGTNDISASNAGYHTYHPEANWTLAAIDLFKDKKLNTLQSLRVMKSMVEISISRAAVDYVFDELNFHSLIRKLELKEFGVDETFWATLNTNDIVNLPGGFTTKFIEQKIRNYMVTRYTVWQMNKKPYVPCLTNYFRNFICIFGVEDLPNLTTLHSMYINKLLPEFDFAATTCLLEHVYNNTYFPAENYSFNVEPYAQLRHVKLHNEKMNV